ncbi:right-handed parallel beta-helix repeat-containing protein [Niastella caeni]|nr:right-handed parallel beta-helix repeat-containing protein [Niastella caeni]
MLASTLNRRRLFHFFCLIILPGFFLPVEAKTHHVGAHQTYTTLTQAVAVTVPGDTIMIHEGNYAGGLSFLHLQGTADKWIYIISAPSATVIFNGGANSWQMSDAAYVQIKGITFQQQTGNGFNIDDGGSYSTPSHHIVFDACTFKDIKAKGNNDLLKMSGVDFFEIKNCTFLNGSAGGSGIDMVGCHEGLIKGNRFENQGSNSIQVKGGSKNIRIEVNFFRNGGQRTLNLGGSTNLKYFRPLDARYEAAGLTVYSNIFIGSDAPIAYVGCIETEVINNTIYLPQKWVIRILQETVDTSRFYACGNNTFKNNIVYRDSRVSIDCNIGAHTNPQSFSFSNNLWYHSQNQAWTGPVLPVKDVNGLIGKDPLFNNAASEDFTLSRMSPAVGKGYNSTLLK